MTRSLSIGITVAAISSLLMYDLLAQQPTPRDFSLYAKPSLIVLNPLDTAEYNKGINRLRTRLWSHWKEHSRAIIRVDARSKYHPPSAMVYFVEPDQNGKWSIAIEIEADEVNMITHAKIHRSKRYRAYSVRRVINTLDGPNNSQSKGGSRGYNLILEDLDGKLLDKL